MTDTSTNPAGDPPEGPQPGPGSTRRKLLLGAAGAAGTAGMAAVAAASMRTPEPDAGRADREGRFAGKVVLITGATSGIGKTTAYAFARHGASVFFCGRRAELGARNEAEIRSFGGQATYMRADVRKEDDVRAFVEGCVKGYGRIDIALNNAGVETRTAKPLHEQTYDEFDDVMKTNAYGVFLSMKYEIPHMLRRKRGVIINTASISAEVGFATIGPYNASKHAIASLTKIGALELAAKNIRVNAFAPGAVDTPMLRRAAREFGLSLDQIAKDYPIGRIVRAEEMARVVMWLASDDATAVVGTDIDASGGYLTG